ncbi:MAG: elongation factor G [Candidatus Adiutrix sp.]|jgi:elongation factor G|nr:elongation factor G [Candidatus Adiutrix sp.]
MKDVAKQRTIALIAHNGAGKTSLAEAMLFYTKVTNRLGSVMDGSSVLDAEPEEIKRKSTINAAFHSLPWKKHQITFVDTAGDENFLNDTKTVLNGVDSAVMVVDAVDGVKVSTEKTWEFTDLYKLPRMIIINKMDRERADFYGTLADINESLGAPQAVPAFLPIGAEATFSGLVSLLTGKAYTYGEGGKVSEGEAPADMAALVAEWKEKMVEAVAEADDALIEKFLEGQEITPEEVNEAFKKEILACKIAPVVPASGLKMIGLQNILDLILNLPSPQDRGARPGRKPGADQAESREPDPAAPFSGLVLKTVADTMGQLSVIRVVSGALTPDSGFYNPKKDQKERFGQLLTLEGKNQKPIDEAGPGDIVAVAKLKNTLTGDTVCDEAAPIVYPAPKSLEPVVSFAVEAKSKGDEEKVFAAINKMLAEDVTLRLTRNDQTKEMILSGMGQVHIDTALEKLKRKYGVEMILKAPKVAYKETIKGKALKVQGKYKKQTGGKGQYGDAVIDLEPLPRGEGFVFEDRIVGGVIPRQFIPAVEKGIVEAMANGVISGNPVVDLKVGLVFGSYHDVDSSEMSFKIAGSLAFKKAFQECKPTILEPVMLLTVTVPDEFMGDVMGDISSRRGKLLGTEAKGKKQIIKAHVPQVEILSYAPTLTSMTGGRGSFSIEFARYDEAPPQIKDKVIAEYKPKDEEA